MFACSSTLPPAQNVVGPWGVIVAEGSGLFVTTTPLAVVLEHPVTVLVTVTLNVPEPVTVKEDEVAPEILTPPIFHCQVRFVSAGALSVTFPPAQNVVGPDAVIAAEGSGLTVTETGEEVTELQELLTCTV